MIGEQNAHIILADLKVFLKMGMGIGTTFISSFHVHSEDHSSFFLM